MLKTEPDVLPVEAVLDELRQRLAARHEVILQAPPGAGKTTLVPLALLAEPWLAGKKILMLEPRRLAAKTAAHRLASMINESPGETVGYRMRQDTQVSQATRIEVITDGILTRMLQADPALADVGLVIFDEYHERGLDADLGLSLCLHGRSLFRDAADPLKLLLMSATLDGSRAAAWLGDAPVVSSAGRQYPVEVIYGAARVRRESAVERATAATLQALKENPLSSILVFLPGQGEITRLAAALADRLKPADAVMVCPLYGNLSMAAQSQAIEPLKDPAWRKVVLATNIAETSLTIEGVDVVVDTGLARQPVYDPATAMTRLQTVTISRASSVQRQGRAGRLRPGRCYRLWSEDQQQQLAAFSPPEILSADLAALALQLLKWGVNDPEELSWFDSPPAGAWQQGLDLLLSLGAARDADNTVQLTQHGELMAALPVHPRLAHMLVCGTQVNQAETAALLASVLSERDPFSQNPDIGYRLALLQGEQSCPAAQRGWLQRCKALATQFTRQLERQAIAVVENATKLAPEQVPGYLLACAYPDRIARRRHAGGYQLANGRGVQLVGKHYLGQARWLAVAEVSGRAGGKGDLVRSAAKLEPALFDDWLIAVVEDNEFAEWDKQTNRFVAEERRMIGSLVMSRQRLEPVPEAARHAALIKVVTTEGLAILPWTPALRQWQARVTMVRAALGGGDWPDVSDEHLMSSLSEWLLPYLSGVNTLAQLRKLDLQAALASMLPWSMTSALDELAPTRITVPSGSSIAIDYTQSPPVLAVKLQEMFGCQQTPTIVRNKVKLLVHLLSPAGRPLQVTQDLAGFWRGAYHEVRKDMKGRYPKHPWPDDPLSALPTHRTKKNR